MTPWITTPAKRTGEETEGYFVPDFLVPELLFRIRHREGFLLKERNENASAAPQPKETA